MFFSPAEERVGEAGVIISPDHQRCLLCQEAAVSALAIAGTSKNAHRFARTEGFTLRGEEALSILLNDDQLTTMVEWGHGSILALNFATDDTAMQRSKAKISCRLN